MSRVISVSVVTAAAAGEALFPPKLIQLALGYPIGFCPTGALAAGLTAGHFIALGHGLSKHREVSVPPGTLLVGPKRWVRDSEALSPSC
jgi:hypothetical protein